MTTPFFQFGEFGNEGETTDELGRLGELDFFFGIEGEGDKVH